MRQIMLRKKRNGEDSGGLRHHRAERGLLRPQLGVMMSDGSNELSAVVPQNFCTLLPTYLLYS